LTDLPRQNARKSAKSPATVSDRPILTCPSFTSEATVIC
jgi:hypothetical protein